MWEWGMAHTFCCDTVKKNLVKWLLIGGRGTVKCLLATLSSKLNHLLFLISHVLSPCLFLMQALRPLIFLANPATFYSQRDEQ